MKSESKKAAVTTAFALSGLVSISISALAVKRLIKNKKKGKKNEENILKLIEMTKNFKDGLNDDMVKNYMEFIENIEINKVTLGVAQDGYEVIKNHGNIESESSMKI